MRKISIRSLAVCLLFSACDKDDNFDAEKAFFEKAEGTWLIHQRVYEDGLTMFLTLGPAPLFAQYGNAVQISKDGKFIPMNVRPNGIQYDSIAAGACTYDPLKKELTATGQGQDKFIVKRINEKELWLKNSEATWQLQKR